VPLAGGTSKYCRLAVSVSLSSVSGAHTEDSLLTTWTLPIGRWTSNVSWAKMLLRLGRWRGVNRREPNGDDGEKGLV
jgi:hypothetical protein